LRGDTDKVRTLKEGPVRELNRFAADVEQCSESAQPAAANFMPHASLVEALPSGFGETTLDTQADQLHKPATRLIETCEQACDAMPNPSWNDRESPALAGLRTRPISKPSNSLRVCCFYRQARWLTGRFPDG
jgi:hypothetical protein